jgi:hypothetical protein
MTSDLILAALKDYIAFQADVLDFTELADLDVFIEGDQSELNPPFIDLTVTGSKEHEVLRGVIDFSVQARIATVPRATNGTSAAATRTLAEQLYDVLGDYESLVIWSDTENETSRIFHATDYEMQTEADSDIRVSIINMTVTGCKL